MRNRACFWTTVDSFRGLSAKVARVAEFRSDIDRLRLLLERVGEPGASLEQIESIPERVPQDYARGCVKAAERWFGPIDVAPSIHALVEGEGYVVVASRAVEERWPAQGGALASPAAAYLSGASWAGATAARYRQWRREREQLFDRIVVRGMRRFTFRKSL
jgi:hypothetical protein